eukprot:3318985-Rhodomonas_salina.1
MPVRGYLNEQSVLAIFADRPRRGSGAPASDVCHALAAKYKVSKKTIRDIWNRRSWVSLTAQICSAPDTTPTTPDLSLTNSDDTVESFASPSGLSADFHERTAALFTAAVAHQDSGLFDDVKGLACTRQRDPFCREWECAITGIDLQTMVTAHDMPIPKANNKWWSSSSSAQTESIETAFFSFERAFYEANGQIPEVPSMQASEWFGGNFTSVPHVSASSVDLHSTPSTPATTLEGCASDTETMHPASFEEWEVAMATTRRTSDFA